MDRQIAILLFSVFCFAGCNKDYQGVYDRASVKVESGKMVKFTHKQGVALVDFTSFTPEGASYRWRFLNVSNQIETAGAGKVRDTSKKIFMNLSYQNSLDTNFYVHAGNFWIPWSYASTTSAWLYYTEKKTTVEILSSSHFETEKLYNHERFDSPENALDKN